MFKKITGIFRRSKLKDTARIKASSVIRPEQQAPERAPRLRGAGPSINDLGRIVHVNYHSNVLFRAVIARDPISRKFTRRRLEPGAVTQRITFYDGPRLRGDLE